MKAARLVRAFLADPYREWRQIELVRETGVTQGYASSKLKSLVAEGYCSEAGGTIRLIDAERLLDDWTSHYRFDRHRRHRFAFHAKSYENGLRRLAEQLEKTRIEYVFTGWSGAFLRAPYGTPREWTAFMARIPDNPEALGLYPVQHGENALLLPSALA